MYEANVDDVGYRLVAIYTPVREDGIEGQPISVSTEPIAVGRIEFLFSRLIWSVVHLYFLMALSNIKKTSMIIPLSFLKI